MTTAHMTARRSRRRQPCASSSRRLPAPRPFTRLGEPPDRRRLARFTEDGG
ncbi:hypothetical protein QJS66_18695 [Kocuria rhizophila]|nr:hypothetical protein QJS66_18695 [Kocuria rhizophila]